MNIKNANIPEVSHKLVKDGVTLIQISKELNYRENSNMNLDDDLFEYTTDELEGIELYLCGGQRYEMNATRRRA